MRFFPFLPTSACSSDFRRNWPTPPSAVGRAGNALEKTRSTGCPCIVRFDVLTTVTISALECSARIQKFVFFSTLYAGSIMTHSCVLGSKPRSRGAQYKACLPCGRSTPRPACYRLRSSKAGSCAEHISMGMGHRLSTQRKKRLQEEVVHRTAGRVTQRSSSHRTRCERGDMMGEALLIFVVHVTRKT